MQYSTSSSFLRPLQAPKRSDSHLIENGGKSTMNKLFNTTDLTPLKLVSMSPRPSHIQKFVATSTTTSSNPMISTPTSSTIPNESFSPISHQRSRMNLVSNSPTLTSGYKLSTPLDQYVSLSMFSPTPKHVMGGLNYHSNSLNEHDKRKNSLETKTNLSSSIPSGSNNYQPLSDSLNSTQNHTNLGMGVSAVNASLNPNQNHSPMMSISNSTVFARPIPQHGSVLLEPSSLKSSIKSPSMNTHFQEENSSLFQHGLNISLNLSNQSSNAYVRHIDPVINSPFQSSCTNIDINNDPSMVRNNYVVCI